MEEINTAQPVAQPQPQVMVQSPIQTPAEPAKKKLLKSKWLVLGIIVVLILISAGTAYFFLNSKNQVACTTEAKLCPDGKTYVGRTGPKCEFSKCPKATPTPTCKPRPVCLDATPRCMIPETSDMCPKSNTPSPTPGGQSFTENGCKIGGCSGEICQNQSDESIASICLYKNAYACYKTASCEKQSDGKCGWTQTAELKSCLINTQ